MERFASEFNSEAGSCGRQFIDSAYIRGNVL
jgi:hypothetical protein